MLTTAGQKAPANSVPAAAVIRRGRVLFAVTGRKGCVGGVLLALGEMLGRNLSVILSIANLGLAGVGGILGGGVQSLDTGRNTGGEGGRLGQTDTKARKRR